MSGFTYNNTDILSGYASLQSPIFTGTPSAPTASVGTNTTQIATTAFVKSQGFLENFNSFDMSTIGTTIDSIDLTNATYNYTLPSEGLWLCFVTSKQSYGGNGGIASSGVLYFEYYKGRVTTGGDIYAYKWIANFGGGGWNASIDTNGKIGLNVSGWAGQNTNYSIKLIKIISK